MTQAELGQSALKAGETVLGGMKLLGGMAYDAAKNGCHSPVFEIKFSQERTCQDIYL